MTKQIVQKDFDFGWKSRVNLAIAELAFKYNRGDVLDVGCGTCQLFNYLKKRGWRGKYVGVDIKKYEGYEYPKSVDIIIGDAFKVKFPKTDTCILYNILEHVDDPVRLLSKSLKASKNVLMNVPKRNVEMWDYGVVEYHQLDKSHKHCGFTKRELILMVKEAGGKIVRYMELGKIDATMGTSLWKSRLPKFFVRGLAKVFTSRVFYQEMWCEVERVDLNEAAV
jgi:SAM-dependent methyltransferase